MGAVARFQSTPPLRREERHAQTARRDPQGQFQSTPPSGERSDGHRCAQEVVCAVSIHAPSGERSDDTGRLVSIHAPLRREERHRHTCSSDRRCIVFQSTPPPERGATETCGAQFVFQSTPPSGERSDIDDFQSRLCHVSIHAPLRREERREEGAFQSTPPSGERSDGCRSATWKFQSTPPSGERSDAHGKHARVPVAS